MIFERSLRRELNSTAGAVFTIVFTIIITMMLIRILGRAAGGDIATDDIISLIGFAVLKYLPNVLILTCFISVLLVVTRTYQDSEMVVWFSSGLGLFSLLKPISYFSIPIAILTAILSFSVTPWAVRQSALFETRYAKSKDISKLLPGRFQEGGNGSRIFFVETISPDLKNAKNIFVSSVVNGKTSIIVAQNGSVVVDDKGNKFAVLDKGRRYEGTIGTPQYQIMEFNRYGILVNREANTIAPDKSPNAQHTSSLLSAPNASNMGELLWRIALPLSSLIMAFLAIPLSFVNPRSGRSANLIIALLSYVTYTNMINVYQSSVEQNRLFIGWAWWQPHVLALLVTTLLFMWRLKINSPFHPLALWATLKRSLRRKGS